MRRSRLGIAVAALVLVLAGSYALYRPLMRRVLASSSLRDLLNRHPDRFRFQWREVSSPSLGRFEFEGLEVSGQTPSTRWRIRADHASGRLDGFALLRRTIRVDSVRGAGIDVSIERLGEGVGPAPRPARRWPWTVELHDIVLDQGRYFSLDRFHVRGPFEAAGGFRLVLGRTFELSPSQVSWRDAMATVGGSLALSRFVGRVQARVVPLTPRRHKGWATFPFVNGKVQFSGDLASIGFLETFLPNVPWIDLGSGGGPLRGEVAIDRGRLVAGSFVEVPAQRAVIDVLQYRVRGACRLGWHVEEGRSIARADVLGAEVGYRDAVRPHLIAPALRVVLTTRDLDLDGKLADVSAEAVLPAARAPTLSRYNDLLPRGSGVEIREGSGTFQTRLVIEASGRAQGAMSLTTSGLRARLNDLNFRGDCHLDLKVASRDVRTLRFDLGGSRGRCDGAALGGRGKGDWWLEGSLGRSFAQPRGTERLHLAATLRARDAEPFLALFGGLRGARIAARILRAKPFEAVGELSLAGSSWNVVGSGAAGPKLGLEARLDGREGALEGDLLLRWGKRALGIELEPQGRQFHFRGAEAWYLKGSRRQERAKEQGQPR